MRFILFILFFFFTTLNYALSLKADAPERYVVQHSDTLWSITGRYLDNPWEWKELWLANPKIKNPNRLYPGAVLALAYSGNRPYIKVLSNGTIKLSPNVRPLSLDDPIPAIPLNEIKPFLNEPRILDQDVINRAPYIVSLIGERMLAGQGDKAYVTGLHSSQVLCPDGLEAGGCPGYL